MNTKNKFEYLFLLSIDPIHADDEVQIDTITDLLKQAPTSMTKKGQLMNGRPGEQGMRYDFWSWEYSSLTFDYASESKSLSERLLDFLKLFPKEEAVWDTIQQSFQCSIYLPVEKDHFQIEFDISPEALGALARRSIRLDISTLVETKNIGY